MKSETHLNYPQLLGSVFSMFISDKILRTRALLGCSDLCQFQHSLDLNGLLLAAPPFNYSDGVIGLFGLAGAAGALGARPAGGFADKGKSHHTTTFGLLLLLLSWLAIWFWSHFRTGVDYRNPGAGSHRAGRAYHNQTVIYRIHPDARNRLTAGYMTRLLYWRCRRFANFSLSLETWRLGWRLSWLGATIALVNLLVWWRGFHRQEAAN